MNGRIRGRHPNTACRMSRVSRRALANARVEREEGDWPGSRRWPVAAPAIRPHHYQSRAIAPCVLAMLAIVLRALTMSALALFALAMPGALLHGLGSPDA